jgi:hypothetical protein
MWSRTGRELFYLASDEPDRFRVMSVDVQTEPSFRAGRPQTLFSLRGIVHGMDVAVDGKRFLVALQPDAVPTSTPMFIVVTDWFADLLHRAPVKH